MNEKAQFMIRVANAQARADGKRSPFPLADFEEAQKELCRACGNVIAIGELCIDCAEDNNPFVTRDNVGADMKRS